MNNKEYTVAEVFRMARSLIQQLEEQILDHNQNVRENKQNSTKSPTVHGFNKPKVTEKKTKRKR